MTYCWRCASTSLDQGDWADKTCLKRSYAFLPSLDVSGESRRYSRDIRFDIGCAAVFRRGMCTSALVGHSVSVWGLHRRREWSMAL